MDTKARVPSAQTGDSRSDGRTSGIKIPAAPGHNVTTNSARHAKGSPIAQPGSIRGGQSAPAGNSPKTGVPADAPIRSMAPRRTAALWSNQADTSKTAEVAISGRPTPFRAEGGAVTEYPGSVRFDRVGVGYDYHTSPDSGPQLKGGGSAPMGKAAMESAASVDGMPSSKGCNAINTPSMAPWFRKD